MSPEPLIVLESVGKSYPTPAGAVEALRGVDASIPAGAITAVVGISGSGKSTLLRLIAGHDLASAGRVTVAGRRLGELGAGGLRRFRRHTVTFMSQRAADNLFPQLTLAEHGASPGRFASLGLGGRLDARADELSGGELARASFAVALGRETPLVVVDEPTAELDEETAGWVLGAMRRAAEAGTTIVVATHDPTVIELADEVIDLTQRRPAPVVSAARGTPGDAVLRAAGIAKSYDGVAALEPASVEVAAGELAVVVGRSGSGKSTLLMVLGGWIEPDLGTVEPRSRLWRDLAYVPQRFGLVPELSVAENVELPARLEQGAPPVGDLFDRLGIADLADRYPAEISIGQQQRVAIARALRLTPRVLLVDEPTSHQDAMHAERVWTALRAAAAAGAACLVATHEPDAALRADSLWRIDGGRLVASSEPLA